jgi:hypothetical protein
LLCGKRPFWDKTEAGIFNEVRHSRRIKLSNHLCSWIRL